MRARLTVNPDQYRRVALFALAALTLIVLTGAAVRLTGSGLGCPDWPKCYGKTLPPLNTHAVIEYSNRILSGLVGISTILAAVLAFTRRPFRRDLAVLGVVLPLGVVAQAVLGGFTVREHLAPGFVMGHYGLSMLVLVAAVALAWRASYEPGERPRSADRSRRLVRPCPDRARWDHDLRGHGGDRRRSARRRLARPAHPPSALQGGGHAQLGHPPSRHAGRDPGDRRGRPSGSSTAAVRDRRR